MTSEISDDFYGIYDINIIVKYFLLISLQMGIVQESNIILSNNNSLIERIRV